MAIAPAAWTARGQPGDVVDLAGRVVRPGQERPRRAGPGAAWMAASSASGSSRSSPGGGADDDEVARRVGAMQPQVALDGVAIGREGRRVDEDRPSLAASAGRPRRGAGAGRRSGRRPSRSRGLGADEPGARSAQPVIQLEPAVAVEVAVDAEAAPTRRAGARRPPGRSVGWAPSDWPARYAFGPCRRRRRQQEPLAQRGQRVGRVEGPGVRLGRVDARGRRSSQAQVREDLACRRPR